METCIAEERWVGEAGEDDPGRANGCARPDGTPLNLRSWIELPILLSWIDAEVERFVSLRPGGPLAGPVAVGRFRKMLQVLCFAYATGLGRSAEILDACRCDPELRLVAGDFLPFVEELRSFRRRYRALLEELLTRLYLRAAASNAGASRTEVSRGLEVYFGGRAKDFLNVARHLDSCDD